MVLASWDGSARFWRDGVRAGAPGSPAALLLGLESAAEILSVAPQGAESKDLTREPPRKAFLRAHLLRSCAMTLGLLQRDICAARKWAFKRDCAASSPKKISHAPAYAKSTNRKINVCVEKGLRRSFQ